MESIEFEKFGIDKCPDENCNQAYTENIIKLSVWLQGIIFLTQDERNEGGDPLLSDLGQEKTQEVKATFGYIGITCPKCLKTSLYKKTVQEVREFKTFLSSWPIPIKDVQDGSNEAPAGIFNTIPMNLRYYSPFGQTNIDLKDFDIHGYAYDKQVDTLDFFDDYGSFIAGEEKDLKTPFCSYNILDENEPAGIYTSIHWFDGKEILELVKLENQKRVRIFPRYHYFHDLMGEIDSLLKYNYFFGQQIDQMLADAENSMKTDLRNYELHYHKKERIEGQKRQNEIDFESPKNFFDILISDPVELKPFLGKPLENCDYLWIKIDPFHGKRLPVDFSFENQPDEYNEIASGLRNIHEKMVDLVQKNYTKQYVQEFLKGNLVDFLEQYEENIQSNESSYAHIWWLKESYLEGLYKAVDTGLRDDVPYAMYSEGETWRIVFKSETKSFKDDLGFLWIYLALLHQGKPVYYTSLNDTYENRPKNIDNDDDIIEYMKYTEELSVNYGGNLTKQFYADKRAITEYTKKIEDYLIGAENAKAHGETDQAIYLKDKLDEFIDDLKKTKIDCTIKDGEVKVMPSKFKDSNYRDINGKIKKNYSDAIKKIKKENPALHDHFVKYLTKKDGAFIYNQPDNFKWHLS